MSLDANLEKLQARYQELQALLNDPAGIDSDGFQKLSKELADLGAVAEKAAERKRVIGERDELRELLADPDVDLEMRQLAEQEEREINAHLPQLERDLQILLLPRDEADGRNAILEVRAGTGGDEAALFAAELFQMYQRFSALNGWKFETMDVSETAIGGFKEAFATITGADVFARLKFESGVHRVQRVPATESGGRIHTSAATVAVLPEAAEIDVAIDEREYGSTFIAPVDLVGNPSTPPIAPSALPICRQALWSPNRMKSRSIKTAPRRCAFCGRDCLTVNAQFNMKRGRPIAKTKLAREIVLSGFAPITFRKAESPITVSI